MDRRAFLQAVECLSAGATVAGVASKSGGRRLSKQQAERASRIVVLIHSSPPEIACAPCKLLEQHFPGIQSHKACRETWFGFGSWQNNVCKVSEIVQYGRAAVPYNYTFPTAGEDVSYPTIYFFAGNGATLYKRYAAYGYAEGDAERIIEIIRWCTSRQ